jgi:hypothetical protein
MVTATITTAMGRTAMITITAMAIIITITTIKSAERTAAVHNLSFVIARLDPAIHDEHLRVSDVVLFYVEPLHGCPGQARA